MPKIVVKRKAEIFKEFPIRPFQNRIKVGSEGDNDLIISDKKVSMHHLLIEKEGTNYYITDTDSAFGTYLNGEKLAEKTQLVSGDEISIGDHTLLFENILFEKGEDDNKSQSAPVDSTAVELKPSLTAAEKDVDVLPEISEDRLVASEVTHSLKNPYYLLAIYGPYIGKKYRLNFGVTKIGRDQTLNDIVIREKSKGEVDTSISRRHATILLENNEFYITDKRSKTRTYVNKEMLHEDSVVKLNSGDEIEIVSDQKSTIFRLVPEGLWDYSLPKKSGDWWIRNSTKLVQVMSGVVILFLLIEMLSSWLKYNVITQKPSPFKVDEQLWLSEDNSVEGFSSPEEIANLMPSMTPLIGDLNGDNQNDLVYVDRIGYLHAIDGNKRGSIWPVNYKYRIQFPINLVLADLNGNGLPDIILPASDSRLYAIDGQSGTEIWSSPLIGSEFSGAPLIADLNGDQIKDVLFCTRRGEISLGFGTFGEPNWVNHQTNTEIRCTPAAGDFDGDGIAEAIVGTENGEVFIFNGVSNNFSKIIDINEELQKAKGSFFEDHQIRGHVVVGNLDGDDYDDFVVTTLQGNVVAIAGKSFKRLWYDVFTMDEPLSTGKLIPAALGDFDADKKWDALLFAYDSKIIAYHGMGQVNGEKKIMWGFVPEIYENFVAYPAIADVNKDGHSDVIAAGLYGGIYIFNGENGKLLWRHENASNLNESIISTPVIGDMGGDKKLDIIIRRANGKFFNLATNTRVPKSTVWWSQIFNTAAHHGSYSYTGFSSSRYIVTMMIALLVIATVILGNILMNIRRKKYFITE